MTKHDSPRDRLAAALRPHLPNDQGALGATWDDEEVVGMAEEILEADPTLNDALSLGLAWAEVESLLPEKWHLSLGNYVGGWSAIASNNDLDSGERIDEWHPTPTAALRALHDRLQSRGGTE